MSVILYTRIINAIVCLIGKLALYPLCLTQPTGYGPRQLAKTEKAESKDECYCSTERGKLPDMECSVPNGSGALRTMGNCLWYRDCTHKRQ